MKPTSITVTRRKLGRYRALGMAHGNGQIEIDARLKGQPHLRILIHEFLHEWEWSLPESIVDKLSTDLAKFLHKHNARMIEPDAYPNQQP
jgi:hypothetical protein